MDDDSFMREFEAGTFPFDSWHHREHIKAAYLYLCQFPFELALERMRTSIQRYNAAQNVPNQPGRGYHETMTQVWMRLVHVALSEYGPGQDADSFYKAHPELAEKGILRLFYSRALLRDPQAKLKFIEPDLTALPKPISNTSTAPLNRVAN